MEGPDLRRHGYGGTMNLDAGDAALRQHRLRAARPRPRARRRSSRPPTTWASRRTLDGYPAEGLGGLTLGVSPLEMADAYATIASGGFRNRPIAITQGRVPRRPRRRAPPSFRVKRTKAFSDGVTYEATQDPPGEHPGRHRHARADRLPGGRQDRHDRQLHRRLVRRLHAAPGDRGLGRLPERADRDDDGRATASRSPAARSRPRSGTTT